MVSSDGAAWTHFSTRREIGAVWPQLRSWGAIGSRMPDSRWARSCGMPP